MEINEDFEGDVAIWQGLADIDPDVDAIYRLAGLPEVYFNKNANPLVLDPHVYAPFNSQNTVWNMEYLEYAYLPSTVTFRFTDILRGYIAQRCLWAHNAHLGFCGANVYQVRNDHNLLTDLESELSMYRSVGQVIEVLEKVRLNEDKKSNLINIYEALVEAQIVDASEVAIIEAWIDDITGLRQLRETEGRCSG